MSWNVAGNGATRSEAVVVFKANLAEAPHCPVKEAVLRAAEILAGQVARDRPMTIVSYGHLNDDGSGNVRVSINC